MLRDDDVGPKIEDALDNVVDVARGDLTVFHQRLGRLSDSVLPVGGLDIKPNEALVEKITQHAYSPQLPMRGSPGAILCRSAAEFSKSNVRKCVTK